MKIVEDLTIVKIDNSFVGGEPNGNYCLRTCKSVEDSYVLVGSESFVSNVNKMLFFLKKKIGYDFVILADYTTFIQNEVNNSGVDGCNADDLLMLDELSITY